MTGQARPHLDAAADHRGRGRPRRRRARRLRVPVRGDRADGGELPRRVGRRSTCWRSRRAPGCASSTRASAGETPRDPRLLRLRLGAGHRGHHGTPGHVARSCRARGRRGHRAGAGRARARPRYRWGCGEMGIGNSTSAAAHCRGVDGTAAARRHGARHRHRRRRASRPRSRRSRRALALHRPESRRWHRACWPRSGASRSACSRACTSGRRRRACPVLVDGLISGAAALVAAAIAPRRSALHAGIAPGRGAGARGDARAPGANATPRPRAAPRRGHRRGARDDGVRRGVPPAGRDGDVRGGRRVSAAERRPCRRRRKRRMPSAARITVARSSARSGADGVATIRRRWSSPADRSRVPDAAAPAARAAVGRPHVRRGAGAGTRSSGCSSAACWCCSTAGWGCCCRPRPASALLLAALALLSGGLHLDGVADTADGMALQGDRARAWA